MKAWHYINSTGLAPDRAELIRGLMIEKPVKSIGQTKLAHLLAELLRSDLSGTFWVRQRAPLTFVDSELEPDISVVAEHRGDFNVHPTTARLVVEVSVSSLPEDRMLADLYAEANVTEYWIVNGKERCIEVYRDPASGRYQTQLRVAEGGVLECAALPGVSISVSELFSGISA